jgi:hypothetical protein
VEIVSNSSLVDQIFVVEAHHGGHGDREHWVLDLFDSLFGLTLHRGTKSEVYLGPGGGRADVLVQEDVVIEVKTNLEREMDDAESQLATYFAAKEELNVGIATDGIRWRFYVRVRGEPRLFHSMILAPDRTDGQFKEELLRALQAFRRKTPPPIDAVDLCDTLRLDTPTFRLSTSLLAAASTQSPRYRIERRAWIGEFSEVYPGFENLCRRLGEGNVETGYDRLFIRHTYLVVIAKLLAAIRIFDEAQLHLMIEKSPGKVLDGQALDANGVHVADQDDYFSWVGNPSDELRRFVRELFLSLVRYDFSSVDEDVFRLLYEEVIDADTRHGIGEFYTPKWLAQFITSKTIESGEDIVLDPACGSGTFLVESIRRRASLRQKVKPLVASDLSDLVEQTWGFDINPLAVLLSRVNLYLAVTRIAQKNNLATPAAFNPHIHTADSLSRVRSSLHRSRLQKGSGFFITLAQSMVPVPASVSTLEDAIKVGRVLSKVCDEYVKLVSNGTSHRAALDASLESSPNAYRSTIEIIVNSLKDELAEGDGIWGLVYRNKVVPLFSRTFDCVVGNPPWLVFREMDEGMKDLANFVLEEHAIRPHPKVKSHFDLAIAFTIGSATYLKPGGRLGFVLPRSLVAGLQHLPFLEAAANGSLPLKLDEIDDLEGVVPPPFPHGIPCVSAFFHAGR